MLKHWLWLALSIAGLCACDSAVQISVNNMRAYELSVATSQNQLAVAWHGGSQHPDSIYLQWLTVKGRPDGLSLKITDGQRSAYEADLQFIAGDALLVWYEKDRRSGALTAWIERVARSGDVRWRHSLGQGGQARNPVVRIAGQTIHVAWIESANDPASAKEPAIWVAGFDLQGNAQHAPTRVADASIETWNLNATVDRDGVFYVVYDAQLATRAKELQLLVIDGSHVLHRSLSTDDGHDSVYPDLGISAGDVALTWFDERDGNREVYLSTGSLTKLRTGAPLRTQRVTNTTAESIGAYLAWNGERLALMWCDAQSGQHELYAQLFDRKGQSLSAMRRLTATPTRSSIPAIRPWQQGFVIVWNEYEGRRPDAHDVDGSSIAMRRWLD